MRNIGRRFIPGIRIEVKEDEPDEKVAPTNGHGLGPGHGSILDKISGIRVTTEEIQRDNDDTDTDVDVSNLSTTNGGVVDGDDDADGNDAVNDNDVDESFVIPTGLSTKTIFVST